MTGDVRSVESVLFSGCSNWLFSKAAANEGAMRTQFVRGASERSENEAGGQFQQTDLQPRRGPC